MITCANVASISRAGDGLSLRLADGTELPSDQVMFATGRAPNTRGLGLEAAGVRLAPKGAVEVDEYSRSVTVPSISAVVRY
jgi:glutathione reductase (NADPH)